MSSSMGECQRSEAVLIYAGVLAVYKHQRQIAYRVDKLDARQVHIVFRELVHNVFIVDGFRPDVLVSCKCIVSFDLKR